jgi:hypothetical protein
MRPTGHLRGIGKMSLFADRKTRAQGFRAGSWRRFLGRPSTKEGEVKGHRGLREAGARTRGMDLHGKRRKTNSFNVWGG